MSGIRRREAVLAALAALLLAGSLAEIATDGAGNGWGGPTWAQVLIAVACATPLIVVTRFPVASATVVAAASGAAIATVTPRQAALEPFLALTIGVFTVGTRAPQKRAAWLLAAVLIGGAVVLLTGSNGGVDNTVPALLWLSAAWVVGRIIHGRTARAVDAEAHNVRLLARQRQREREVIASERARIARELHDVVAHNVSVIVVQAQAAQRAADVMQAQPALQAIETVGRQTVDELRRLLGILRSDDEDALSPPASLKHVDTLVGNARAAGLTVDLAVTGPRNGIPAGVDVAGYRIVQECLTNVIKHAAASAARVRIDYDHGHIDIAVEDDGGGPRTDAASGHGLVGMRERVALYGGSLTTGQAPGGGFRVAAVLPYSEARA